ERVSKRMFRLAIVTMFVNRDPIDGLAFLVRSVGVAFVVLHVDAVVENLTEPDADRFEDAEKPVQDRRPEIRVVNEVVRDAVDVPGNADRINEAEDQHYPERRVREEEEHSEKVSEMEQLGPDRNDVPAGERENLGISLEPLG